jgi:DNA-binding beta-propeller fold protein YncE
MGRATRILALLIAICCLGALASAATAGAASSLLWVNAYANKISRADLTGGGGSDITPVPAVAKPSSVAVDAATGKLYFGDEATETIYVANLDGSGSTPLPAAGASVGVPEGLVVDAAAGKLYWADGKNEKISWAALDGSGGGVVNTGMATVYQPEAVAIDPALGRIYWASTGVFGDKISWASLVNEGEARDLPLAEELTIDVDGVAIDVAQGRLYWTAYGSPALIGTSTLDGGMATKLPIPAEFLEGPRGLAIDTAAGRIYWTNENNGTFASAALDGSAPSFFDTTGATKTYETRAPSLFKTPEATAGTTIGGGATLGSTLTCKPGTWAADQPETFLYRAPQSTATSWTLNGSTVNGAAGQTLSATQPGTYACRSTATNGAGSTTTTSGTITVAAVPAAPLTSPTTSVRLTKVKFDKEHGTATILANVSGPGTLTLNGKKVIHRSVTTSGAGIAKLKVATKGNPLKTLIKSGRVKVRVTVAFAATEGARASSSRAIVLHRTRHHRA